MQACQIQLCTLRPEIVNLEIPDALAMMLACKIADAEAYRKCALKQKALADFVSRQ